MKKRIVLYVILALSVLVGAGGGSFHWYQVTHFIQTKDARVAGDIYRITSRFTGKLQDFFVAEGETVIPNQMIVQQEPANLPVSLLDQSELRASSDGTVMRLTAKSGEVVPAGQPIALIVNKQTLYISANIKEDAIRGVFIGQYVDLKIDAYPEAKFIGKVQEIGEATISGMSSSGVSASGNFTKVTQIVPVKISIDDQQGLNLIPGMSASIQVHL